MNTRREIVREEQQMHRRRLLVSIACGVLIGGTIGALRVLSIL